MASAAFESMASRAPTIHFTRGVYTKAVSDGIVLALAVAFYIGLINVAISAMYSGLRDVLVTMETMIPAAMDGMLGSTPMASPEGWINAEVGSMMGPWAVVAVTIIVGVKTFAAERHSGSLLLLLANPVSRTRVVVSKMAAVASLGAIVALGSFLGVVVGGELGGMGLSLSGLAALHVHMALLGAVFTAVAVLVGTVLTDRKRALQATFGMGALAWLLFAFVPASPSLADWAAVSPWYYYFASDPLVNGLHIGHAVVLAMTAVGVGALATWRFNQIDEG